MLTRQKLRKGIILCSFFIFPAILFYFSPFLIIQATSKGIVNGSFVVFSLLFLSALILGRGYCGWVCPGAGCQEAISIARNKKVTKGDYIKWLDSMGECNFHLCDEKRWIWADRFFLCHPARFIRYQFPVSYHLHDCLVTHCNPIFFNRQEIILSSYLLDGALHDNGQKN